MATIGEQSKAYEPPTTKNIADLEVIDIQWDMKTETFTKKETGEDFTVDFVEVCGERYRVPTSVLKQLKEQMAEISDLRYFKVRKTGTGLGTEYTVIPLHKPPQSTEEKVVEDGQQTINDVPTGQQ